jgi:hypothetical protein
MSRKQEKPVRNVRLLNSDRFDAVSTAMAKYPKIKLCVFCVDIRDDKLRSPVHLIHPVSGMQMLFDERGEAVCPICQAKWRRERNVMSLAA